MNVKKDSLPIIVSLMNTKFEVHGVLSLGHILGALEITANLYCNCVHLYREVCVIFSIQCLFNFLYKNDFKC